MPGVQHSTNGLQGSSTTVARVEKEVGECSVVRSSSVSGCGVVVVFGLKVEGAGVEESVGIVGEREVPAWVVVLGSGVPAEGRGTPSTHLICPTGHGF